MKKKQFHPFNQGYRFPYNLWSLPKNIYVELKAFYQRGLYGYSDRDLWSLDEYLSSWMPSALRELEEKPIDWNYEEVDLEEMAQGFEIPDKMNEIPLTFPTNEYKKIWNKLEKERIKKMRRFVDKYSSLWW